MLARLANDTGGRVTRNTNDLSLGFARAQRDLGCVYTLGFYLRDDVEDMPRNMSVRVLRGDLRALHPEKYLVRSESARRESQLTAAFLAPEMFRSGNVRAHLFILQPRSKGAWSSLLAVDFPVRFQESGAPAEIDFGATVSRGAKLVHQFNRRVSLRERAPGPSRDRRFMFLEPMDLAPGDYEVRLVTADLGADQRPDALLATLEVPEIPKGEVLLVPTILGRPRDENVVVRGDGPAGDRKNADPHELARHDIVATRGSFEPLLVQRLDDVGQVLARNKACLVGRPGAAKPGSTIDRAVTAEERTEAPARLPPVPLALSREDKALCQNVFEALPAGHDDDGRYVFETTVNVSAAGAEAQQAVRFAVRPAETPPEPVPAEDESSRPD